MYSEIFPWSDNWWIEGEGAWFCAEKIGAVFYVDLIACQCELVTWLPFHKELGFREYTYCIKKGNVLFCLPNRGKHIWSYNIERNTWDRIPLDNKFPVFVYMNVYGKYSNKIWMEEGSSGKIYGVDLQKKAVEKEYNIPQFGNSFWGQYILVGEVLYCLSGDRICCVNINSNEITNYVLPGIKAELYTICFDGFNFWLSGHCKEIYIWNPVDGMIKIINCFPRQFGIYHFREKKDCLVDCDTFYLEGDSFFIASIFLGKYVWYIPDQANEILYIDAETYAVNVLGIVEEIETIKSMEDHIMPAKYVMQYIRENRYIGLYSLKNYMTFEIDTVNLCVVNRKYFFSSTALAAIVDEYDIDCGNLLEGRKRDTILFNMMIKVKGDVQKSSFDVGQLIYNSLNK